MQAWLQHKSGKNDSFLTERVEIKTELLPWQARGLQYTATGYGRRIPTPYKIKTAGKWRRVYCCIFSNVGTLYIGKLSGDSVTVQINN